jgi:hypothetical protein
MFNWSSILPDTDVTRAFVSWPKGVNNNKPDQSIQWPQNASWGYYTDYYTCVIVKEISDFQSKLALLATKIAT